MNKGHAAATLTLVVTLTTSCAASGPVQIGRDTYMVANTGAWSWSSGAALKGELYQQANAWCHSRGLLIQPIITNANNGSLSDFAHAELQFRCLNPGDPEIHRPFLGRAPDVVIENH